MLLYVDLITAGRLRVVPIFPRDSRASETRACVKITPREKSETVLAQVTPSIFFSVVYLSGLKECFNLELFL